ncbi:predicted protein [Sclerotinia sclerotiorum 1980 UF-70]|uniref:Uncharacterized protein n=2 Tax=Sclerotinia sclerotiorum (strain ATCC 18683 / 1980 / Ss-1) TaxID=665079 RepID=A7E7X6_SCLS1|nr:predicted protein [Sclerotinia sclerotiorum 1980 UF-70]APA06141.1 hypothetical protein sscle_01g009110 [Sclerotinia sclerotiorum 1980 UF-70]EDN96478.1 predicted protein [Sclerotinia sclerotiorum 1980 UF-70]
MCIHKRMIFTECGHSRWGKEVKACDQELAFRISPATSVSCDTIYAHPMHSIKIGQLCKACEIKRGNTDKTAEKLKQALKDIRESVGRMEKMQGVFATENKASIDEDFDDVAALESWD